MLECDDKGAVRYRLSVAGRHQQVNVQYFFASKHDYIIITTITLVTSLELFVNRMDIVSWILVVFILHVSVNTHRF